MSNTAFFPAWRSRLHRRSPSPLREHLAALRRCTLDKLEARFGHFFGGLDELSATKASAREALFGASHLLVFPLAESRS